MRFEDARSDRRSSSQGVRKASSGTTKDAALGPHFMQNITGYIIGMAKPLAEAGMERETAVKALSDWLDMRT